MKRNRPIAQAKFDYGARHSVDHTSLFRFGEDHPPLCLNPGGTLCPIRAHARHNHSQHAIAVDLSCRLEEDIH